MVKSTKIGNYNKNYIFGNIFILIYNFPGFAEVRIFPLFLVMASL